MMQAIPMYFTWPRTLGVLRGTCRSKKATC